MCWSVLGVCWSVLDCVAVCFSMLLGGYLTICRALLYKVDGIDCVLQCVAVCCSVLQCCSACSVLQCCSAYRVLQCLSVSASLCLPMELLSTYMISSIVPRTAYCNTLQHTATHCNTLQHTANTATHYNILQHAATRCDTLQHTATHTEIQCEVLSCRHHTL